MGKKQNVHGEGNYAATRKYNEGLRRFIRSGRVEQAARDAAPTTEADELQMAAAETEGKRRAKAEDPALRACILAYGSYGASADSDALRARELLELARRCVKEAGFPATYA